MVGTESNFHGVNMDQEHITGCIVTEPKQEIAEIKGKVGRPRIQRFVVGEIEMGKEISAEIIARVANIPTSMLSAVIGTNEWNLARLKVRYHVRKEFMHLYNCKCFVENCGNGLRIVPADGTYDKAKQRITRAFRSNRDTARVCADVSTKMTMKNQDERLKLASLASDLAVVNNSREMREVRRNLWRGAAALPTLKPHDHSKEA